jgi:hypothetical protein
MELLQTSGYDRKLFLFELREFRDADFTLAEPRQQPEPRGVSERSEHRRSALKLMAIGRLPKGPGRMTVVATALVQFMERYVITNDVVNAYGSFSSAQAQG